MTHGFVLDDKGRKMSKSLGNVTYPRDLLAGRAAGKPVTKPQAKQQKQQQQQQQQPAGPSSVGVDVLRWWAASCDFTTDCSVGPTAIQTAAEHVRKLRNTLRFILGALHGYSGAPRDGTFDDKSAALLAAWSAPPPAILRGAELDKLTLLDRAMLQRLAAFHADVRESYRSLVSHDFSSYVAPLPLRRGSLQSFVRVVQRVNAFVSVDLSAHYLDACKDRLYSGLPTTSVCNEPDETWQSLAADRAACLAILREVLRVLVRAAAPILPFLVEDVFQYSAAALIPGQQSDASTFAAPQATLFDVAFDASAPPEWASASTAADWAVLVAIQAEANRALEEARAAQLIGSALEARIIITVRAGCGGHAARVLVTEATRLPFGISRSDEDSNRRHSTSDKGALEAVFGVSAVEVVVPPPGGEVVHEASLPEAQPKFRFLRDFVVDAAGGAEQVSIEILPATGAKCSRCWKISPPVETHPARVCVRCDAALTALGAWGQ